MGIIDREEKGKGWMHRDQVRKCVRDPEGRRCWAIITGTYCNRYLGGTVGIQSTQDLALACSQRWGSINAVAQHPECETFLQ